MSGKLLGSVTSLRALYVRGEGGCIEAVNVAVEVSTEMTPREFEEFCALSNGHASMAQCQRPQDESLFRPERGSRARDLYGAEDTDADIHRLGHGRSVGTAGGLNGWSGRCNDIQAKAPRKSVAGTGCQGR